MNNNLEPIFVHAKNNKRSILSLLKNETKRWEYLRISATSCYQLLKLFIGIPECLTSEGIYPMRHVHTLTQRLGIHQQKRFIELICQSGSFTFLCDQHMRYCYGFFSTLTLSPKNVETLQSDLSEWSRIPVAPEVTQRVNEWMQREETTDGTTDGTTDEKRTEKADANAAETTVKTGNFSSKNLTPKKCNIYIKYKNYILVNNIININNPPTEDTLSACTNGTSFFASSQGLSEQPTTGQQSLQSHAASSTQTHQPGRRKQDDSRQKKDYGSAEVFFHQLNENPEKQNLFFNPHRKFISERYPLSFDETRFVLIRIVKNFLIPTLNGQEKFKHTPPRSRLCWLNNLVRTSYYLQELEHAYRNSLVDIQAYRQQQTVNQQLKVRANRPVSSYEWTDPKSQLRHYEDPVNGVVDLPADAPPRPSATTRWNIFTRCWEEPTC